MFQDIKMTVVVGVLVLMMALSTVLVVAQSEQVLFGGDYSAEVAERVDLGDPIEAEDGGMQGGTGGNCQPGSSCIFVPPPPSDD